MEERHGTARGCPDCSVMPSLRVCIDTLRRPEPNGRTQVPPDVGVRLRFGRRDADRTPTGTVRPSERPSHQVLVTTR